MLGSQSTIATHYNYCALIVLRSSRGNSAYRHAFSLFAGDPHPKMAIRHPKRSSCAPIKKAVLFNLLSKRHLSLWNLPRNGITNGRLLPGSTKKKEYQLNIRFDSRMSRSVRFPTTRSVCRHSATRLIHRKNSLCKISMVNVAMRAPQQHFI